MNKDFNKLFINNKWIIVSKIAEVKSPYDGKVLGKIAVAGKKEMKNAINAADTAFLEMKNLPVYKIADGLSKMRDYIVENFEEIAKDLSSEAGKPITIAKAEVNRALHTFEDGIEECKRMYGETLPMDRRAWGEKRKSIVERFPIGVIAAMTPFNFPLNLVVHKIVPAIASKNTVVLRPATQTPFCSYHLAKAYEMSGLPAGGLNVLTSDYQAVDEIVGDKRVKMISFTGSPKVGWDLKKKAWNKEVVLELGGNAAVIVEDSENLDKIATLISLAGFSNAGQSCISAQRIFVKENIYDKFLSLLKKKVEELVVGDPANEKTQVASIISKNEADRIMEWIEEARKSGAKIVTGGKRESLPAGRQGNVIYPTILTNTKPNMKVNCLEIFGPVVTVIPYKNFDDALKSVNNSDYGLQAGIFTQNVNNIFKAYQTLDVGGVIINDTPTWRIDHMPYGGIKESGVGREGVRYAMEEMTQVKLLVISLD